MFLDASPLLALLLETREAEACESLLGAIESGRRRAVTTPNVLEEVAFKLVVAKASEFLSEKNPWKIREALKREARLRNECGKTLDKLMGYVRTLEKGGLNIVEVHGHDVQRIPSFVKETGLLTADCLHLIVMDRLGIREIGTIDSDFNTVKNLTVIP